MIGDEDSKDEKSKLVGMAYIKNRSAELLKKWLGEITFQDDETGCNTTSLRSAEDTLQVIAREFADLENDFEYIKETAQFTARRYSEVSDVFPSLREIDALIKIMEETPEDSEMWDVSNKKDRMMKIKKFRTAIKAMQG